MPQIKPKERDKRLRFYGDGKPRVTQPGETVQSPSDPALEAMISRGVAAGAYLPLSGGVLSGNLTLQDVNIILGTATGTKIGTSATQKLSMFNATPIVQPSSTGEGTGFTAGGGTTATHLSTFTGNVGSKAYTVGDLVKHLKNLGLLASS